MTNSSNDAPINSRPKRSIPVSLTSLAQALSLNAESSSPSPLAPLARELVAALFLAL